MKQLFIINLLFFIFLGQATQAQRCDKFHKYCDVELKDGYDYENQSAFIYMYPGDTIPLKMVLYGNKNYHINVCSEASGLKWKIVHPTRKTVKEIEEIRQDTSTTYKVDEYGDYIVDDATGEYIVESMEVTSDTIWSSKRVSAEDFIFDNSKEQEWNETLKKTQRIFVYVTMPEEANPDGSCVAVLVGSTSLRKSRFKTRRNRR